MDAIASRVNEGQPQERRDRSLTRYRAYDSWQYPAGEWPGIRDRLPRYRSLDL